LWFLLETVIIFFSKQLVKKPEDNLPN